MDDKNSKSYMQLQMEELKEMAGVEAGKREDEVKEDRSGRPEDAEIAGLYADAAEYEEELARFEQELEVIKACELKGLVTALDERFQGEEQNYAQELKAVVESGWKQFVEVDRTHPQEQLALIQKTEFGDIAGKLAEAFPEYRGDFEKEVKGLLLKRWGMYIEIKKEHIKEETSYIKAVGLKPHYAKKVYKRYHGIE